MFQLLTDYIRARVEADDESLAFVLSHFKPVKARRGEILLHFGDVCRRSEEHTSELQSH